jgi:uncharacterized DUF497 family protein
MFEWDENKNQENIKKHGVSFEEATEVFSDSKRITLFDEGHSQSEDRYFCIGETGEGILTVRFVLRNGSIRIIGAGYWRKGKEIYEQRKQI